MKFDKFFKRSGTHGNIVTTKGGDKWLICENVAMLIPPNVNALSCNISEAKPLFDAIVTADTEDDVLELYNATIPADGKPKDIIRIFKTETGDRVGITNDQFGLLERSDRLVYCEIEDELETHIFILVTDRSGDEIVGFIEGIYV